MVKVLTKSGDSLADVYDVTGSIAGIESLQTEELPIVHEMGSTIFSERLSGSIRRAASAATLQSANFTTFLNDFPSGAYRILGVQVLVANPLQVDSVQVSIVSAAPGPGREIPIFIWDDTNDVETRIFINNEGVLSNVTALVSSRGPTPPSMGISFGQPQGVGERLVMRGLTNAFGGGTMVATCLVYVGFTQVAPGLSSRGLPVPSW